ncbi:MAG: PAS domain-containing protein [Limnohabitans sp.]|jgi:PAS domain S-box-containing protein
MANQRIVPTDHEIVMRDEDFIVSKTDLKGRITYANQVFIEFSGFRESEFIGKQHNVIRHPDMPRAIFKLLWDSIQSGREIFAYVKNICKDGSYYWVLANVTPSFDASGKVVGYYSVRRKPNAKAVRIVHEIYKRMLAEEQRAGARDAIDASTRYFNGLLAEKGVSYEQFVLELQSA